MQKIEKLSLRFTLFGVFTYILITASYWVLDIFFWNIGFDSYDSYVISRLKSDSANEIGIILVCGFLVWIYSNYVKSNQQIISQETSFLKIFAAFFVPFIILGIPLFWNDFLSFFIFKANVSWHEYLHAGWYPYLDTGLWGAIVYWGIIGVVAVFLSILSFVLIKKPMFESLIKILFILFITLLYLYSVFINYYDLKNDYGLRELYLRGIHGEPVPLIQNL